jgi:hypothetical protein
LDIVFLQIQRSADEHPGVSDQSFTGEVTQFKWAELSLKVEEKASQFQTSTTKEFVSSLPDGETILSVTNLPGSGNSTTEAPFAESQYDAGRGREPQWNKLNVKFSRWNQARHT